MVLFATYHRPLINDETIGPVDDSPFNLLELFFYHDDKIENQWNVKASVRKLQRPEP